MSTLSTITDISAGITLTSELIPILAAAYNTLRSIWGATNPGKTDADFIAFLKTASTAPVSDATAQLLADGWVMTSPGVWQAPSVVKT